MKTYEEMARDVLKRRDEELQKIQQTSQNNAPPEVFYPASKKRRLLPKIAIPCAAAVLVGAVGVTLWNKVPRRGEYIQNYADEVENPENQRNDIALEAPFSQSGTPAYTARETKINIVRLDSHRLGKNEPADVIHVEDSSNCKYEPLTMEELNELYRIEFNKLSRLHTDWSEEHGDLRRIVREYPSVTTESYMASGSREIISTLNSLTYKTPNGAEIEVSADRDFKTDLSKLGFSEEDYSVLNGYQAIVASASYEGETLYGAVIDMEGTNVQISAEGLSESEFVQILREYTDAFDNIDNSEQDCIYIHDIMPESFRQINPFNQYNDKYDPNELTFEPINDINRYYGFEFDRLTRLHSDWNEQRGDLGIYTRTTEDEMSVTHEIVWTRNRIYYTLPNTAEFYVEAQHGSLPALDHSTMVDGTVPEVNYFSKVNGYAAMIYRGGDSYDTRIFPNGDTRFGAVVEMEGTLVHLSAAGLTEEEFIMVLREYIKDSTDNKEPIAVGHTN